MTTRKITSKARVTIRQTLRLGDTVADGPQQGQVVFTKAALVTDDPFATFSEWSSDADTRASANL